MIGRELLELRRSVDLMWNLPDAPPQAVMAELLQREVETLKQQLMVVAEKCSGSPRWGPPWRKQQHNAKDLRRHLLKAHDCIKKEEIEGPSPQSGFFTICHVQTAPERSIHSCRTSKTQP